MRLFRTGLAGIAAAALVAACGGGGSFGGSSSSGATSSSGSGSSGASSSSGGGTIVLSVKLVDSTGAVVTQLNGSGQTATGVATLTSNGSALANQIVTFTAGSASGTALVTVNPTSGAVLTDATGAAKITVTTTGAGSGAISLTAAATVGTTQVSGSTNFSVNQSTTGGITLSGLTASVGSGVLSSYGTTALVATVTQASGAPPSSPVTVTFSTSCPAGKATVTASTVTLADGTAQGTFVDNGCAQTSQVTATVTASIATGSKSTSFKIGPPSSGSIKFVSVVPSGSSITLKGQGGAGRVEYAKLTFSLVDVAGNGVANYPVCFDATTYVGGLTVDGFNNLALPTGAQLGTAAQCGADNTLNYIKNTDAAGSIVVQVNSGTTPTPVRIRARSAYPASSSTLLETLSNQLSISTGLAIDHNMDLSVDASNIDGRNFSGVTANLTVRLADLFGNPVPDGTVVNFVTSGGAICTSTSGSCATANGACSCLITSQDFRPPDGRVVVMAYTVGLPDYVDVNHNYQFDPGIDTFTPLGDAFLDANKNGTYDTGAINGETDKCFPYTNGAACAPTANPSATYGPVFLRRSGIVFFSGTLGTFVVTTTPVTPSTGAYAGTPAVPFNCPPPGTTGTVIVNGFLIDDYGNPMAAGTKIAASFPSSNVLTPGAPFPASVPALGLGPVSPVVDFPNVPKMPPFSSSNPQIIGTPVSIPVTVNSTGCASGGDYSFDVLVNSPMGSQGASTVMFDGNATARAFVPMHAN